VPQSPANEAISVITCPVTCGDTPPQRGIMQALSVFHPAQGKGQVWTPLNEGNYKEPVTHGRMWTSAPTFDNHANSLSKALSVFHPAPTRGKYGHPSTRGITWGPPLFCTEPVKGQTPPGTPLPERGICKHIFLNNTIINI